MIKPIVVLLAAVICSCWDGETWASRSTAKTGDPIVIQWEVDDEAIAAAQITGWKLYRQSSLTGYETEDSSGSGEVRQFITAMPRGTSKRIRYVIRPMIGSDIGPAGQEILVDRVK